MQLCRVTVNYGGSDITRLFYWLISEVRNQSISFTYPYYHMLILPYTHTHRPGSHTLILPYTHTHRPGSHTLILPYTHAYPQTRFPYRECRADNCLDGVLLQQLKESVCHMDATQWGVHDYQFSVMSKTPGNLLDYEIKLSDEALLAPMGVFFPSSFCLPDNRHLMAGPLASTIMTGASSFVSCLPSSL